MVTQQQTNGTLEQYSHHYLRIGWSLEPWSYDFFACMEMDRILIPLFDFLFGCGGTGFPCCLFSIFLFDNGRAFPHI
ncbi:hypothetical protein JS756_36290, partial [Streptomyces actuosus]|nr:hypothetical protein [Streptomyces actuosus]